jgi:MFS family permease
MSPFVTITATTAPPATAVDSTWSLRRWGLLAVLCLVLFLDGLDVSMVGVALPAIGDALGLSTSSLQWIVSGYVLGYGGLLLLGGRTADLLGRRRVFLLALAAFAIASVLGGLVDSGPLLIATRFVKGISAAFTAPTGLSIITTSFAEGPVRNRALSIYTVFGASGFSSGLVFGGLMAGLGWRWTFLFSAPIAVVALIGGLALIPRDRPVGRQGHDILGAALLTGGMMLLVYTLVAAPDAGWGSPSTIGMLAAALAALALFVAVERRTAHPLVRLGILRSGAIARANVALVTMMGSYISFQFVLTLFLQSALGWSPLKMALALLPAGVLVVASAPFSGRLIDRFGTARMIGAALASLSLGYLLFLRADASPDYVTSILPSVLLIGAGFGLGFSAINVQATTGVDDDEQGLAAGLVQTSGQVGAALVLAVTTALITSDAGPAAGTPAQALDAFRPGLILVAAIAVAGLVVVLQPAWRSMRAPRLQGAPQPAEQPIDS